MATRLAGRAAQRRVRGPTAAANYAEIEQQRVMEVEINELRRRCDIAREANVPVLANQVRATPIQPPRPHAATRRRRHPSLWLPTWRRSPRPGAVGSQALRTHL